MSHSVMMQGGARPRQAVVGVMAGLLLLFVAFPALAKASGGVLWDVPPVAVLAAPPGPCAFGAIHPWTTESPPCQTAIHLVVWWPAEIEFSVKPMASARARSLPVSYRIEMPGSAYTLRADEPLVVPLSALGPQSIRIQGIMDAQAWLAHADDYETVIRIQIRQKTR